MCYYNSCRISNADNIRLRGLEKELFDFNRGVQSGFEYRNWPIVRLTEDGKDLRADLVHWELIPAFVHDVAGLQASRKRTTWLNAKSENLWRSERGGPSMWASAAKNRRCLVLSSGFFEYRHLPKIGARGQQLMTTEAYPYYITLAGQPKFFFMAGIWQTWTNEERGQSADTFAIVTTEANGLMAQVHNKRHRQPTILTQQQADRWLEPELSKEEISALAASQWPAEGMEAWTVGRDYLKQDQPAAPVYYPNLPEIEF